MRCVSPGATSHRKIQKHDNPRRKTYRKTQFTARSTIVRNTETELELTVLLTVVSGADAVRESLTALTKQIDFEKSEIIVPFDKWSSNVGSLISEFPGVRFHFIEDLGFASDKHMSAHQHRLYDRRRAVGLRLARGRIVAMTEDHARPADDWVRQMIAAHEQPYDVIGGAIENGVDSPLNRAWYYCDFGRYGRPFERGEASFVSDVNLAYKRTALIATYDLWHEFYQETTVHWAMRSRGNKLFLDDGPVVFQMRPHLKFGQAMKERVNWGRVFAETRANNLTALYRFLFSVGTLFLPLVLSSRVLRHMRRQRQTIVTIISTLPIAFVLLICWSVGEFVDYFVGMPKLRRGVQSRFS